MALGCGSGEPASSPATGACAAGEEDGRRQADTASSQPRDSVPPPDSGPASNTSTASPDDATESDDPATRALESASKALKAAREACSQRDGDALWALLSDRFRSRIAQMAQRMASALSAKEVAKAHGYDEPVDELTPETYLTITLHSDEEHENVCWRADDWEKLAEHRGHGQHHVLYGLPGSDRGRGVIVARNGNGWVLHKITQSLRPAQFRSLVPDYGGAGK